MELTDQNIKEIVSKGSRFEDEMMQTIIREIVSGKREFLNLIQDPTYEFDDGLYPRMRNWYDNKGLYVSNRKFIQSGKRKLSFVNRVWFQIVLYTKEKGMNFDEIKTYKNFLLTTSNKYNVSPLDLYVMTASCNLNIVDYYLFLDLENECPCQPPKENIRETANIINFSELIRIILFVKEDESKLEGKSAPFLGKFNKCIDDVRKLLADPPIDTSDFFATYRKIPTALKLSYKPFSQLQKRWDVIYQDQEDNLFGFEIKYVGKAQFIQPNSEHSICKTDEEVMRAIKNEIYSNLKYKSRNER